MNTENSKRSRPYKFKSDLTGKLNLKNPKKNIVLANFSIYHTWKNIKSEYSNYKFKIYAPTRMKLSIYLPTKKSFHHSGGIPVEFHWSHGKLLENDWSKWNLWNSSEIPLEFQQFIILTPLKFHLSKIFVENWR